MICRGGRRAGVPGRMAPLVLVGTAVTHLFGGWAGREGAAVQVDGGAIIRLPGAAMAYGS